MKGPDQRAQTTAEAAMKAADPGDALPELDFATFLLSLMTSALVNLGEPIPGASEADSGPVDLPMARQTIDIIAMLGEKTRGNRTAEEDNLLSSLLYDLRMRYVAKVREGK